MTWSYHIPRRAPGGRGGRIRLTPGGGHVTGLGSRAAVGSDRATPEAAVAWPQRYRAASDARGGSQILMIYVSYSVAVSFMNFLDFFLTFQH